MNDWPVEILAVQKQGQNVFFCPSTARLEGYSVYPLVEIDIKDVFGALSNGFGIQINYLFLAKIEFYLPSGSEYRSFNREEKFSAIHKSIFLSEIESGVYLEALYVNMNAILVVLGNDESWVVLDRTQYPQRTSELDRLVARSRDNIQVLQKSESFEEFFKT